MHAIYCHLLPACRPARAAAAAAVAAAAAAAAAPRVGREAGGPAVVRVVQRFKAVIEVRAHVGVSSRHAALLNFDLASAVTIGGLRRAAPAQRPVSRPPRLLPPANPTPRRCPQGCARAVGRRVRPLGPMLTSIQ